MGASQMNPSQNGFVTGGTQVKSGLPGTLYEKLGGEEGMKIFVEKVFTRVLSDPNLKPFFYRPGGMDIESIKLHFSQYMTHLTNTIEGDWQGKPLALAHRHYPITDELFDAFNRHCTASAKDMKKLKIDGLKELLKLL